MQAPIVVLIALTLLSLGGVLIFKSEWWATWRKESIARVDQPVVPGAHSYRTQARIGGAVFWIMAGLLLWATIVGKSQ